MNKKPVIILLLSVLAVMGIAWFGLTSYWRREQSPFKDAPKLIVAVQKYVADHKARRQPMPASIALQDLVDGGYITPAEVRPFDGMEVTISLGPDQIHSKQVLMRVRLADGERTALMADGTVEDLPK